MLNKTLPIFDPETAKKTSNIIKLGDGDELQGVIIGLEQVPNKFNPDLPQYLLKIVVGKEEKRFYTSSKYVCMKLNTANVGDTVRIVRHGVQAQTRWDITIIPATS